MPEKLDLNRIQQSLVHECNVSLFESINSTNEWALQKIRDGKSMPFACFAEQQTQGRGRRGKTWVSPPLCNIYMSLAWLFDVPVNQIGVLSLATGIGVVKMLEKIGIQHAMLKWPNDVLVDDKKIAGILIETTRINEKQTSVVIGIGLNYHLPDYRLAESSSDIPDQLWTDIVTSLKTEPEGGRNHLAGLLLQECMTICERMPQDRNELIDEFQNQYDACIQKMVSVILDNGERLQGLACGVTSKGEIRILIDGKERVFNSAEISLRRLTRENQQGRIEQGAKRFKGRVHADN